MINKSKLEDFKSDIGKIELWIEILYSIDNYTKNIRH
jgi:hypothetical protein